MAKSESKRMTSIVRRLHHEYILRKICFYIMEDMLIFGLLAGGFFVLQEYNATGKLTADRSRSFIVGETQGEEFKYVVRNRDGELLLETEFLPVIYAISIFIAGLGALQVFLVILPYYGERRKIRRILRPINEIALKADELARRSAGEDKYQRIEDVITRVRVTDDEKLSFGDEDLLGIEAAMNNLLLRMRDANLQQARFVNDASHELRTPIAVIRGYADMLDRWGSEDEKVLHESITAIRNEADHMNRLVEQLLFLARGDAGKTELHPEKISLPALTKELFDESVMIDEKHRYLLEGVNESGGDDETFINVDVTLFKQAARILVDNAAKYTKEGDEIIISCGVTEGENKPYLQVQDTGIGMANADVGRMFERFYRSDDARTYKGTGLGLSIAKWIIDRHKGHFEILSREKLGTRVRIVLDGEV